MIGRTAARRDEETQTADPADAAPQSAAALDRPAAKEPLPDFSWKHVTSRFTGEDTVQVAAGGAPVAAQGYEELGFADKKSGLPNRAWAMLRILASNGGTFELPSGRFAPGRSTALKTIQELKRTLRALLETDDNPVPFTTGVGQNRPQG